MTTEPRIIEFDQVAKAWKGRPVLRSVSGIVAPGITGLLGPNGSGKTTLIGMVLGLHHPDGGQIRVLGAPVSVDNPELRMQIGYSPEHHRLPGDMRAVDLVRHVGELHGLPAREAMIRASETLWLVGLGEERNRGIGTMSTGQRQRVKLAQAIAHGPRLVVLDEPTDGLDPIQRDRMLDLIRQVGHDFGMAVLISSHNLDEVTRICDEALILHDGTMVEVGTLEALHRTSEDLPLEVEFDGPAHQVETAVVDLERRGLRVHRQGRRQVVEGGADGTRLVAAAAAEAGIGLRSLRRQTRTLEQVFLQINASDAPETTPAVTP